MSMRLLLTILLLLASGIGDFRYIENSERCVTETLRLVCAVVAACTSERPLGSTFTAPEPIRQVTS